MMPAILLTLISRTQTLVVENNRGQVACPRPRRASPIHENLTARHPRSVGCGRGNVASTHVGGEVARTAPRNSFDGAGARRGRVRERQDPPVIRRGPSTIRRSHAGAVSRDELPVASSRAAAGARGGQKRRRRSDRGSSAAPLALVPTYPGDERLFRDRNSTGYPRTCRFGV